MKRALTSVWMLLIAVVLAACAPAQPLNLAPVTGVDDIQLQGSVLEPTPQAIGATPFAAQSPAEQPPVVLTPTPEPTIDPDDPAPYMVYIEKGSFTLTIFRKDHAGEYVIPVMNARVAIGRTDAMTPTGDFTITRFERWHEFSETCHAQYATRFTSGLYIHSAWYREQKEDEMIPSSYKEIGAAVTSGCIRTTAAMAAWIYENCPEDTPVRIAAGSPLGTTSEDPPPYDENRYRQDPTDPAFAEKALSLAPQVRYATVPYAQTVDPKTGEILITDMVDVREAVPSLDFKMIFATDQNFTGTKLYPVDVCLLQRGTAQKLKSAQDMFLADGYNIRVYDAYRPHSVQYILFEKVGDTRYIANPASGSKHNRGAAVDITLVDAYDQELLMPSPMHTFNQSAHRDDPGMDRAAKKNMDYMAGIMTQCGFTTLRTEWWHFNDGDYKKYAVTDLDLSQLEWREGA